MADHHVELRSKRRKCRQGEENLSFHLAITPFPQ
jgi:hypothetical protein